VGISTITAVNVVGARPNFMKIAPIHRAMVQAGTFDPLTVHTGQHYDWEMSDVFVRDLGLPVPDLELGLGPGSHVRQTAEVMLRLEPYLEEMRPDLVIVVGDVNSTLGAALAASKMNIRLAHVEAGLRSFDASMPEEINRVLTDAASDLLFAPSREAVENLMTEGIGAERVYFVGNVMIDTLELLLPRALESDIVSRLGLGSEDYLVATLHRPSNVDSDTTLREVASMLREVVAVLPLVFAAHPRTRKRLEETRLLDQLEADGVRVLTPLGYIEFLGLMSRSKGVLTDSGGVQEETTILGVPCLTLRDRTERPVTVTEGTNQVVGLDRERILTAVQAIAVGSPSPARRPELWDGHAAERIVSVLKESFQE
jgi:UDP-N-acetylglucosamine 2-epimerase (non-hydrolysing)